MDIRIRQQAAGVAVVEPRGRIDFQTAPIVKQRLHDLIAAGHTRLVVNLKDVPYIDSTGLGALLSGLKLAHQGGGDLRLAEVGPQVRMVIELASLTSALRRYATVADACASFR